MHSGDSLHSVTVTFNYIWKQQEKEKEKKMFAFLQILKVPHNGRFGKAKWDNPQINDLRYIFFVFY